MLDPRNAKSTLVPVALVRYRFGPTANIPLHFHAMGGRSLFFYPSELPHRDGQWIFVEFAVAGSDVPFLARGRVRAQSNSKIVGSWLEFPRPDLPSIMQNLVCRIVDVSADGLRLSGLPFFLKVGEDLSIEMVGMPRSHSDLGKGRVVWVRAQEAGIHFARTGSRRTSLVKLVEHAVAARSTAIQFAHLDSCRCRNGERPIEAPPPAIARR